MQTINIKNRFTGTILFEYEKKNATIKDAVTEAVKNRADLGDVDLGGAYLGGAYLRDADLRGANLRGADLSGADLGDAKNIPYFPFYCPSDGAFIGWKKVGRYLIKLQIPEDAKRCSATGEKCRCDKAMVLDITCISGKNALNLTEIINTAYTPSITYRVGEMVYPDSFDENRWNECSHGIHFFINKQDAINY